MDASEKRKGKTENQIKENSEKKYKKGKNGKMEMAVTVTLGKLQLIQRRLVDFAVFNPLAYFDGFSVISQLTLPVL